MYFPQWILKKYNTNNTLLYTGGADETIMFRQLKLSAASREESSILKE
jgi:hypothetical protein